MNKMRLFKAWTFFRRGHGVYLVFIMSFLNFLVIQWRLLVEKVEVLNTIFSHFYVFSISFIALYIPFSVLIGWLDYRKGSVSVDLQESAKASPYNKDMARAITYIAKNDNEAAAKILKKWL